jgi:6-pyruvoyltetrahydropterin/6-carboxytetrahydropterin synthase
MRITQAFTFEAAHHLPNVGEGHRCSNVHGHSYRVELTLAGPIDPHTGFVIDFFEVERAFAPVLGQLDHQHLNLVGGLENPTAENIAQWVWNETRASLPSLALVRVFETPLCWAEYDGDGGYQAPTSSRRKNSR